MNEFAREHKTQPKVYDVESKELDPETRRNATDTAIKLMSDVFSGIEDYTVFASTGMYMNANKYDVPELDKIPGDFDANVFNEETLHRVRERLANVPGVAFDNGGEYIPFPNGAEMLGGHIKMEIDTPKGPVHIKYPFEIFRETQIVRPDARFMHKINGLNVLTFEGLKKQYIANLALELQVEKNAEAVITFLLQEGLEQQLRPELMEYASDPEKFVPSQRLQDVAEHLDMTFDQIKDFYGLESQTNDPSQLPRLTSKVITGLKSKADKRRENVEMLRDLLDHAPREREDN